MIVLTLGCEQLGQLAQVFHCQHANLVFVNSIGHCGRNTQKICDLCAEQSYQSIRTFIYTLFIPSQLSLMMPCAKDTYRFSAYRCWSQIAVYVERWRAVKLKVDVRCGSRWRRPCCCSRSSTSRARWRPRLRLNAPIGTFSRIDQVQVSWCRMTKSDKTLLSAIFRKAKFPINFHLFLAILSDLFYFL